MLKSTSIVLVGARCCCLECQCGEGCRRPAAERQGIAASVYLDRLAAIRNGLHELDSSDTARGLYSTLVNWPPEYTKLRVCFMGGSDAVNSAVAKVANTWNTTANLSLKFDFGKLEKPRRCKAGAKESQVRVSYDKPGYWSLLAQYSVTAPSRMRHRSIFRNSTRRLIPANSWKGSSRESSSTSSATRWA